MLQPNMPHQTPYFFDRFHTIAERLDLAYEILRVAQLAEKQGIYLVHLWNPDMWAWLETSEGGRPHFMGFHNALKIGCNYYADFKNSGLKISEEERKFIGCPSRATKTNYVDAVVYGIIVACDITVFSRHIPY